MAAKEQHGALLTTFDALFCETNPIPVKAALAMLGRIREEIRLPMTPITPEGEARVRAALRELGLLS